MRNEPLLSFTSKFFMDRGYTVEYNLKYEGFSGLLHTFDLLVRKGRMEHIVFVMNWKRTVGIDTIIKAEKAAEDVDLAHPIIIANKFSEHAKSYSNKKRITLMTEREIISKLLETK